MESPVFERCPLRNYRQKNNNYSREILLTRTTNLTPSLAKARCKIKMKENSMEQSRVTQPLSVSNHLSSRPPEPPSAFLNNKFLSVFLVLTLFISLALGSLVVAETSRTKNWAHSTRSTRSQHSDLVNSNYIQQRNPSLSGPSDHRLGHGHHSANKQQRNQNQQEQNQLRYLIARTAAMPQLIGRDFYKSSSHPMEELHSQTGHHNTDHLDNKIVGHHHQRNHHPEPVQRPVSDRIVSIASTGHVQRRKPLFGVTSTRAKDFERYQFGHSDRFVRDFDSLDVELDGFDDDDDDDDGDSQIEDSLDDVDDDDDAVVEFDNDAGSNDLDDGADVDEDNTTTQTEATEESNSIPDSDGDKGDDEDEGDDDEQNSIQLERITKNRSLEKNRKQANTLYKHSAAGFREAKKLHDSNRLSKINSNVTKVDQLAAQSLKQQLDEKPLEQNLNWRHEHNSQARAISSGMVTLSPFLDQLEMEESREQASHHLRASKQQSQPSAPYQSPVVVSISDNSFVSASPISVGMSSDEQVDSSKRFEGSGGTARYSHIIASPKNELSLHGKRYWHESHIQMIQEEPSDLHRGNINSALIAILFGIGVTGTLIMIVSIKMRSIRERVAYKGRRRSLVPDTDFLINTIPM